MHTPIQIPTTVQQFILIVVPIAFLIVAYYIAKSYFYRMKKILISKIRKEVRLELEREIKNQTHLITTLQPTNIEQQGADFKHQTYSQKYEQVTVLFADIQGFTRIVEHMNPDKLVDELDKFFLHFDEVVETYGIEKIKTIGDAYMCAGGLPEKNRTNPVEVVLAAYEMQKFMKRDSLIASNGKKSIWELRIGIHTGPVISGLVGRKKISFDIWGDTVNIASRMESSGIAGEVNITGVTFQYIRDFFVCQYRGKMPIKYKGETDMYFVKSIIPELSVNGEGFIPNKDFFIRLQHIRYEDLEEYVIEKLKTELPEQITYHNYNHTLDVITRAEVVARGENISEDHLLLIKTAALLHDIGFITTYKNHEAESIKLAQDILVKFRYRHDQIEIITNLIKATSQNVQPTNLLEEIIKDADLDYLGRADYLELSQKLFEEWNEFDGKISTEEWNLMQYKFIMSHKYYTNTARRLRQVNKVKQLEKLKILSQI